MSNSSVRKWKWIYFGLAILDLVAIGTSLVINHRLGTQYNEAVSVNEFWTARLETIEELQALASDVNAPGNDVFDSHDVKKERERLSIAIKKYDKIYHSAIKDLEVRRDEFHLSEAISSLEAVQLRMDDMLKETELIFHYIENKKNSLAGSRMATMDRKYASLRQTLITCSKEIRKIQTTHLQHQRKIGEELRFFEIIFSIFIGIMILGMLIYGTVMSRFISAALEDKKLLEEQTHALDAAAIVAITDLKGKIKYVNKKFEEISGYSKEELVGKDHRIINSGRHEKDFFKGLWKTLSEGRVWRGEVKNKKRNGEHYWVDSTIIPMKNARGAFWQYVAIRFDVT